uniref:Solute carrier organic anion transporter family member n=1 Tax=Timema douglasi TaxID=61478 RepID=A0A7R8ZCW7_TIMDO|nr:unnamed protein product [Timema douglasi]
MGKWRNSYSRAPEDNSVSPENALTSTNVKDSTNIGSDPTVLLNEELKNELLKSGRIEKLKTSDMLWETSCEDKLNSDQQDPTQTFNSFINSALSNKTSKSTDNSSNISNIVSSSVLRDKINGLPKNGDDTKVIPDENKIAAKGSSDCMYLNNEDLDENEQFDTDINNAEDLNCGLGPCAPKWLQIFASKQAFLVTFCITWVLQGMYYTYFVSVITTIEKLFQIQSKTTGIIMSATEIGQIGSSLLLTYYGGQGHRPKWIAWGMVLFAVSSFACSLPHFLFGKQLIQANDLLFGGVASTVVSPYDTGNHSEPILPNICRAGFGEQGPPVLLDNLTPSARELFLSVYGSDNFTLADTCAGDDYKNERRIQSKHTTIVLSMFFISLLGVGMGQTAVYTLGIPYIDDNVASRESPLYFAITIGVRILGPALGFILGSVCTRLYADLSVDPQITPTDPRWVGAWWLGLVMVSALLMLASLAMFSFPKRLRSSRPTPRALQRGKKNPSLRDFPKAVKRLLKNDILMFRTASSVLHILPIAGLYTFLPKYLESQFRLAAHTANMISGVGGILVMGLGIIISGVFILRVKPNARFVAAWIAFTAVVYALGMGILMFIGCPMDDFAGLQKSGGRLTSFEPVCNTTCDCDKDKFSPICGRDGKTYFSACHAGCRNITIVDGKILEYSDCLCMQDDYNNESISVVESSFIPIASIGYCDLACDKFVWYIILFSLFVFVHSTSEVGSMLLILRCVDPRDKAMALGLIQFAIGLFGNVPCPIVYGAVVDSACLVWETTCGERGACWLYDANVFRMFFHACKQAIPIERLHYVGEDNANIFGLTVSCVQHNESSSLLSHIFRLKRYLFIHGREDRRNGKAVEHNNPRRGVVREQYRSAPKLRVAGYTLSSAGWTRVRASLWAGSGVPLSTTGAILLCAFFVDIIVWYKAGSINFVDEQVPIQEEELDPIASKTRSETSV